MARTTDDLIREQLRLLQRHLERDIFDPKFVEVHASYIVNLARLEVQHAKEMRDKGLETPDPSTG